MLWKKILQKYHRFNPNVPGKRMNSITEKTLENLHSDAKNLYVVREEIINEMSNNDYSKWAEKPVI